MKAMWADQDVYACMYPELQMRLWATPKGMRVAAVLWLPGPKFGRRSKLIQDALWAPQEVSEAKVVEWGRNALAKWLADEIERLSEETADLR